MGAKLTEAQRAFLAALVPYMGRWVPQSSVPWSDRKSDRARQKLKSMGLVVFSKNTAPKGYSRWQATPAGRQALADASTSGEG